MDPLIIRALDNQPIERPPVWMMRQAGRYLPEYRALKQRYDFLTMCKTPELAVEVTLQPVRRLKPDAAILFADILLPAESLGIEVAFNPGPSIVNPIKAPADIDQLRRLPVDTTLDSVFKAIAQLRRELQSLTAGQTGLLGFAGAPWTMACYLIDQGPYKHFQGTQVFAAEHPQSAAKLLTILADLTTEYLSAQIDAGAQAVQLFDTWAGNLSEPDYRSLALPYTQSVIERLKSKKVPIVLYVNGSSHLLPAMRESGAHCLSVDWRTELATAEKIVGDGIVLQGNFDPTHLYGTADAVAAATKAMLTQLTRRSGYVANLGHGILQRTPVDNAQAFISTVQAGWPEAASAKAID